LVGKECVEKGNVEKGTGKWDVAPIFPLTRIGVRGNFGACHED
jgi:hypothetical protein